MDGPAWSRARTLSTTLTLCAFSPADSIAKAKYSFTRSRSNQIENKLAVPVTAMSRAEQRRFRHPPENLVFKSEAKRREKTGGSCLLGLSRARPVRWWEKEELPSKEED